MSSLDTDPAPFVASLASVWGRSSDGPRIRFVWIFERCTTANAEAFEKEVSAFARCAERHPEVMAGIDLAGDESVGLPEFLGSRVSASFSARNAFEAGRPRSLRSPHTSLITRS